MYKVLIVDDDIEILEYIENLLQWEELGFLVAGTAVDGNEALEMVKKTAPDLLITDITMPGITGIELVRQAKQQKQNLKSIILTCHESFNYAREALQLEVQEYLVKYTLEREQLESSVKKVKRCLDEEEQKSQALTKSRNLINKNTHMLVAPLLKELIGRENSNHSVIKKKLENSALAGLEKFCVICFCIDDWEIQKEKALIDDIHLLQYAITNVINEIISSSDQLKDQISDAYACQDDMIVAFWKQQPKAEYLKNICRKNIELIQKQVWELLKVKISCIVTAQYEQIMEFGAIYRSMRKMQLCYFYKGSGSIIWNPAIADFPVLAEDDIYLPHELLNAICTRDLSIMWNQINQEYTSFSQSQEVPAVVVRYYNGLMKYLESELWKQHIDANLRGGMVNTFHGYLCLTRKMAECFLSAEAAGANFSRRKDIATVIHYLNHHLQDKVTCEDMAQLINMNVSYFSKLFKKETGESFSDYLIKLRINHATALLMYSELTMDEITSEIGLSDMHYFHRLYKKQTGKTPGEVRKLK